MPLAPPISQASSDLFRKGLLGALHNHGCIIEQFQVAVSLMKFYQKGLELQLFASLHLSLQELLII